jgi:hypothetical protein
MTAEALIGLIMLVVLLGAIFIGVPISFTLLFLALAFGYLGMGGSTVFDLAYLQTIGMMKEELLAAVPLFVFMGFITEQAGLMERLFVAFRLLLAPLRGSLYLVVILTSTVFAMATGIVGAAVTVLGIMAAPIMTKSGYDAKLSAGTITAGGTLGILIPPSVMLVVMGPVLGVSVADLYAAAFGPGFLLAGIYILYLMGRSFLNPKLGPPVPVEERVHSLPVMLREVVVGTLPLLLLITATLGTDRRLRRSRAVDRLRPLHVDGPAARHACDDGDVEHGIVVGRHLQRFWSRVRAARHGQLDHRFNAVPRRAADGDADPGAVPDLRSRLAVRMACHRPRFPADLLSGGCGSKDRSSLVRRARRRRAADRLPVATGGHVCLLPETGHKGLEPRYHLQRHVPVHDAADRLHRPSRRVPEDRYLVSRDAAGQRPRSTDPRGAPEDHRQAA